MNRIRLALALLVATPAMAMADVSQHHWPEIAIADPAPAGADSGIRTASFVRSRRIRITSTDMTPVVVQFPPGEVPKVVAGVRVVLLEARKPQDDKTANGKKQEEAFPCLDWCATHEANFMTFQPMRPDIPPSVVTVIVQRDDEPAMIPWAFQLEQRTGSVTNPNGDQAAYFQVLLTDPEREAAQKAVLAAQQRDRALAAWRAAQAQKASDRLQQAKYDAPRNWKWEESKGPGCDALQPLKVSDDGMQTRIYFGMNTPASQPYQDDPDGKPAIIDFHPESAPDGGTIMVVHKAPPAITLVRGNVACRLVNAGYNANAVGPGTGTISADVVRESKAEPAVRLAPFARGGR